MRMPYVEGLNSQVTQTKQKVYSKVHSEPMMTNNGGATGNKEETKKRRVLHTHIQPDGSVVGFCTEESDEDEKPREVNESFPKK